MPCLFDLLSSMSGDIHSVDFATDAMSVWFIVIHVRWYPQRRLRYRCHVRPGRPTTSIMQILIRITSPIRDVWNCSHQNLWNVKLFDCLHSLCLSGAPAIHFLVQLQWFGHVSGREMWNHIHSRKQIFRHITMSCFVTNQHTFHGVSVYGSLFKTQN